MKKIILAALVAASVLPAVASEYYVVVPVKNRTPTSGNITVALNQAALPAGVVGRAYAGYDFNALLQVHGDPNFNQANVQWSVVGGVLPEGLTLSPSGQLSGTPTAPAKSALQVRASYMTKSGQQTYEVVVADVIVALAEAALPGGMKGESYFFDLKPRLSVTGVDQYNSAEVTWTVRGALPAGLALTPAGTITGVPSAGGTSSFEVVAAYLGKSGTRVYEVVVGEITVALANATPPAGTIDVPYAGFDLKPRLTVSGDVAYSGTGVVWSVAAGSLPAGLTLDSNSGVVAGTPTGFPAGPVTVKAAYKKAEATQSYSFSFVAGLKQYAGYRAWADGALAASCNAYRNPAAGGNYRYTGSTGDGVYRIDVDGAGPLSPFDVVCDMTTDNGGWTVMQRRVDSSVSFARTYAEYAAGFGNTSNYWLGNDRLAQMTADGNRELRVELVQASGVSVYARYSRFKVNNAADGYRLSVTSVGGTVLDSLTYHNGLRFSTIDVDNDEYAENCVATYQGAWWHKTCYMSSLNGTYGDGSPSGIAWAGTTAGPLVKAEMKVR